MAVSLSCWQPMVYTFLPGITARTFLKTDAVAESQGLLCFKQLLFFTLWTGPSHSWWVINHPMCRLGFLLA
jgi:hypothetical protein